MPTLAWEPGDPPTPYHLHSFVRLDRILTPDTATPYHDHYQPRHLPHVIVGGVRVAMDLHRQWYMYMDLLRGTAVVVSSFETRTRRLPEADLYFRLGVMAVFNSAEDSGPGYYHAYVTLLERAASTPPLPPSPPTSTLCMTTLRPPPPPRPLQTQRACLRHPSWSTLLNAAAPRTLRRPHPSPLPFP